MKILRSKLLALVLSVLTSGFVHAEPTRPNVILILSDDQGYTDYGFMGHPVVRTPNLDRMAAASLLYTRGYVSPVCSPSLASLLTGQLPHVHGITGNDLGPDAIIAEQAKGKADRSPLARRLLANPVLLPRRLAIAGYLTLQTGKLWNTTAPEIGFTDGMTQHEGRHGGEGLVIGRETMQPIYDFIEKSRDAEQPFFIWHAPYLPHEPHNPPERILARYRDRGLSKLAENYYAMVEWFDETCGELDAYLEKNGLRENTVIIYLADNGWDGEKRQRDKLSPYELGIRTPVFLRWPGHVEPRRDDETLVSIVDFVPTVLALAGQPVPEELPGLNLLDRDRLTARQTIFVEAYSHDIANLDRPAESLVTRVVIDGWTKLLLPGPARPDERYRHRTSAPTSPELFDLKSDPEEQVNLAAERPEEVARLTTLLNAVWDLSP